MSPSKDAKLIQGKITVTINGEHYIHLLHAHEADKFAVDLQRAYERGHNPAEALAFLANVAVITYYPLDFHTPRRIVDGWKERFGTG